MISFTSVVHHETQHCSLEMLDEQRMAAYLNLCTKHYIFAKIHLMNGSGNGSCKGCLVHLMNGSGNGSCKECLVHLMNGSCKGCLVQ